MKGLTTNILEPTNTNSG